MSSKERIWNPSDRSKEILQKECVSAEEARDVIVECFCQAFGDEEQARIILNNKFIEAGMTMNSPDKDGLIKLIMHLENVAKKFRDPEIILQNRLKIEKLLRKCS